MPPGDESKSARARARRPTGRRRGATTRSRTRPTAPASTTQPRGGGSSTSARKRAGCRTSRIGHRRVRRPHRPRRRQSSNLRRRHHTTQRRRQRSWQPQRRGRRNPRWRRQRRTSRNTKADDERRSTTGHADCGETSPATAPTSQQENRPPPDMAAVACADLAEMEAREQATSDGVPSDY